MLAVRRRNRGVGGDGQSLTEFALIAPVLFMMMLGVLDAGLLMFSVGTSRYAVTEGARLSAQLGNATTADDQAIQLIRKHVGTTGVFSVTEVDIYKLNKDASGNLAPDPVLYNKYQIDGTPMMPEPWPAASRNIGNGTSDFLGVTLHFTYQWKAGFLAPLGPVKTTATYYIRLEPQSY